MQFRESSKPEVGNIWKCQQDNQSSDWDGQEKKKGKQINNIRSKNWDIAIHTVRLKINTQCKSCD